MPLGAGFPLSPYEVIRPEDRWYPGSAELGEQSVSSLIPPLVADIRKGVAQWRDAGYPNISATSSALLRHWFGAANQLNNAVPGGASFQYYFAQREAVETVIWLYEAEKARDPYSLLRYDGSGAVSAGMFAEHWTRYVCKLATGAGKTKVLALLIAWSYFHKKYESDSTLSTNFLLIAPNIIVLDRLLDDFRDLRIFVTDPILPPNGYEQKNWHDDFQLRLHIQDDIKALDPSGNLFVSNVHRLYEGDGRPSFEDDDLRNYFLGNPPQGSAKRSVLDLAEVIRGISDLVILNDEAHHIHDEGLSWFKVIEAIDTRLRQRNGQGLSVQLDVTATPKHSDGQIFVQTVCSYPLVEAIRQRVVKTPVVPDPASRLKLVEHPSDKTSERYADHLKLGYLEWAKRKDDLAREGKKAVMFVMTPTTTDCDEVASYLERAYPALSGKVLVIHTKANGDIAGQAGDDKLDELRKASSEIDSNESPYVCVVSVLMLREGWDVQNVISMVGLRPYTSTSKVLPEQTLGRGLRRMFRGDNSRVEYVSVVGTDAFLDFIESIKTEGVELEQTPMDAATGARKAMLIEVELNNPKKDVDALDIVVPRLSARVERKVVRLSTLSAEDLPLGKIQIKSFNKSESRVIAFHDLDKDETAWLTDLGQRVSPTPQSVLSFLTMDLMRRIRLVSGKDDVYRVLKEYVASRLFSTAVDLNDWNVLRNLCEVEPRRFLYEAVGKAINALTLVDSGDPVQFGVTRVSKTRPFSVNEQEYLVSGKSVFNKIVCDRHLELRFAQYLDRATDVIAFAKNYLAINFFLEYVRFGGEMAHYYPDFLVRTSNGVVYVVETKGLEDLDVLPKWNRLKSWCEDASRVASATIRPLYVAQRDFDDLESRYGTMHDMAESLKDRGPAQAKPQS